jgi:hypothetical protein
MIVITSPQTFFDFLTGKEANSVEIPEEEIDSIDYENECCESQGGPWGMVKMKNSVEVKGILVFEVCPMNLNREISLNAY